MPLTVWSATIAPGVPVRAGDIEEIRAAVALRRTETVPPLSPMTWTDLPLQAGVTPIKAVHFTELRQAIEDLWQARDPGCRLPPWTADGPGGTGPAPGRPIYAQDVLDLRAWLNQHEDPTL